MLGTPSHGLGILKHLGSTPYYGSPVSLCSICSAHPLVIAAAVRLAVLDGKPVLLEATCNQVNQFGGYSGMRPGDFRDLVHETAARHGLASEAIILGGDHLGPNPWRHLPAAEAMTRAEDMVEEYVREGFVKIHLDASMSCSDDPSPLPERVIAERALRLCKAAERARQGRDIFYVIGTEVPAPGGSTEALDEQKVTTYAAANATLEMHREVFTQAGCSDAWSRVIALVVHPGVEFNHEAVADFAAAPVRELRKVLSAWKGLVFEAHSTDYQLPRAYKEMVGDGYCLLKVGPALTFALREALFALAEIEEQLVEEDRCSRLPSVIEAAMLAHPEHWEGHYTGTPAQQKLLRRFSYSDRIRYYWNRPEVEAAVKTLFLNLDERTIPITMLSAAMPQQYFAVRSGRLKATAHELVIDRISEALRPYKLAC